MRSTRRTVTIDLFRRGADDKVESLLKSIVNNVDFKKYIFPLVDEATEIAQVCFEGDTDVRVTYEETENGYQIVASGEDVVFQEFGAGTRTYSEHPLAQNMPVRIEPGSWSELHSQQFSKRGWWEHNGVRYEIDEWVTPHLGMMAANERIVSRLS